MSFTYQQSSWCFKDRTLVLQFVQIKQLLSIGTGTHLSDSKTQALKRATPGISKLHSKGPNSKHFGVCLSHNSAMRAATDEI